MLSFFARRDAAVALVAVLCLSGGWAAAQAPDPALLAAARKEGVVRLAGDLIPPSLRGIKIAFEKEYPGITLETTYITGPAFATRLTAEQNARQHLVDVSLINVAQVGVIERFQEPYASPQAANYDARNKSGVPNLWTQNVGISLGVIYNNQQVTAETMPKSLEDLLHPRWKDRIGVISPLVNDYALNYFSAIDQEMGRAKATAFFEALAKQKPLFFGPNGTPLAEGVKNGQFAVAMTFLAHVYSIGGGESGTMRVAPVPGYLTSGMGTTTALLKTAPSPNAAKLLIDFLLSRDGANVIRSFGYVSTYNGIGLPDLLATTTITPSPPLANAEELKERLRNIFGL